MELKLEVYGSLCSTKEFSINGVEAEYEDFGEKYDHSPDEAEDYACGNMKFTANRATQEILDKYKINITEYNEVCEQLEQKLSFGSCGWCV
jgi:hypothetical protein